MSNYYLRSADYETPANGVSVGTLVTPGARRAPARVIERDSAVRRALFVDDEEDGPLERELEIAEEELGVRQNLNFQEVWNPPVVPFVEADMRKRSRTITAPNAMTSSVNYKSVNRVLTLSGREFWQDVTSFIPAGASVAVFQGVSRQLRPTDSQLFSWLAGIAKKFEEFKFSQIRFVYEPQCSSLSTGQVAMWFDGDPTHIPPTTWNNVINTGANAHGAPWAKHVLDVPAWLFASRKSYYTQAELPDAKQVQLMSQGLDLRPSDPLEYYPGLFGWSTEGYSLAAAAAADTTVPLGKVYLEYTVQLKTQNVDGYNQYSTSGGPLSAELADISGTGYFWKASSFGLNIFGGSSLYSNSGEAGCCYFTLYPTSSGVLSNLRAAKQDFECLVTIRATHALSVIPKLQYAAPAPPGVAPTFVDATTATPCKSLAIDALEAAAPDWCGSFQAKWKEGYFFRVVCNALPTYFHMTINPWTYGLQS